MVARRTRDLVPSPPPALWFQGQVQTALQRRGGPLMLVRGDGCRVWDNRGRSYLDARSGLWTVTVGYGRREVVDAVDQQLRQLAFAPLTDAAAPIVLALAERLRDLLPGDLRTLALAPTGSEAVDTAFKLSRLYHSAGRRRRGIIISREYSAHGSTYVGSSLSDPDRGLLRGIGPRIAGIRFVPAPFRYRCRYCARGPACTLECIAAIEAAINSAGSGAVAAVFAEPVPGPGGVLTPPPEYWPSLRALCDRRGVLLVADEVVTGFGRTGRWFACDHWSVVPDLMILGKGMTGGYQTLGAVAMRGHIADRLGARLVPHGFTYSGHPAACTAALACLEILERDGLVARAATMGALLLQGLRTSLCGCPIVGEIRGLGLMAAVELVEDPATRVPLRLHSRDLDALESDLRVRGVLAFVDNPVMLAPPLIISEQEVALLVDATAGTIRMLAARMGGGRIRLRRPRNASDEGLSRNSPSAPEEPDGTTASGRP
jgi:adenosylmethionine-8-amino-7-oxononanoate aminotransferase